MQHAFPNLFTPASAGKARRFIPLALLMSIVAVMIGSFAVVNAQEPVIFTGDITYTKGADVLGLPQAAPVYTDLWAVQIAPGIDLNSLSRSVGFENLGQIGSLQGFYLVRVAGSTSRSDNLTATLRATPGILWAEQQIARQQYPRVPSDPLLGNQWHLNNTGQGSGTVGADANVFAAWNAGFTGAGVQIAIVDDGLQKNHPDIAPNYFAAGSWDFNSNEADPTGGAGDRHGTAAGGVAAAADDGAECGVGVAYNAQMAGLRLIAGPSTDAMEAQALSYALQQNDIYNNSWGPSDDGATLGKPGPLLMAALANGVATGRGGLGNIFVWAGGNGHDDNDNANADGYANSRYVIAVAATTNAGVQSWYSEVGANIMVNAPSNGGTQGVTTTDLTGADGYSAGNCTGGFGGTSSAAPLVAGVAGLILEANPSLTWRDVMHVLINSAEKNDPTGTGVRAWEVNGAGHDVNYAYGFGRVDAGAAVALADTWTNVPANVTPFDSGVIMVNEGIPDGFGTPGQGPVIARSVNVPQNFVVEHVEVVFDIDHATRGEVIAAVESPAGTTSTMLFPRINDMGNSFDSWKTSTLRHWGEESAGTWTIRVADNSAGTTGTLNSLQLIIYGYPVQGGTETETPVPTTETPVPTTETPTPTTETPTPTTETPTPEPVGELIENGGFEVVNASGKPVIDPWVLKNGTGDKGKCDKPEKNKFFAYSGNCAFRFKGGPAENSSLMQTPSFAGLNPQVGDALDLVWMMDAQVNSSGKLKLVVKYGDGTPATKVKGNLSATNGYELWGTDINNLPTLASANIAKVKLIFKNTSPAGKIYIDDVSLVHLPAGERILGLPGASSAGQPVIGPR